MCLKCSLVKFVVVSHVAGTHSAPLRSASLVPFQTLEVLILEVFISNSGLSIHERRRASLHSDATPS